jgi:hypothetical protein
MFVGEPFSVSLVAATEEIGTLTSRCFASAELDLAVTEGVAHSPNVAVDVAIFGDGRRLTSWTLKASHDGLFGATITIRLHGPGVERVTGESLSETLYVAPVEDWTPAKNGYNRRLMMLQL